jgi:hypothetical protein
LHDAIKPAGNHHLLVPRFKFWCLGDTVNLEFAGNVIGKSRVTAGGIVSSAANSFPFSNGFRAYR